MLIEVLIPIENQAVKDILIALLPDLNFNGFEEGNDCLKGYVEKDDLNEDHLKDLLRQYGLTYSLTTVEEKNWNEAWERDFSPVIVGSFCSIRAHFHQPVATVSHEIIITPKMSFGTGHHATTHLMIQQMEQLDFDNKAVADFGTGTGVLSILAEKLGAQTIWAIDNDDWGINNARENFQQNSCSRITLEKKDDFSSREKFDIILANINRNVILGNLEGLAVSLVSNGFLLLSGLLQTDESIVNAAVLKHNFKMVKVVEKDKWISILLTL